MAGAAGYNVVSFDFRDMDWEGPQNPFPAQDKRLYKRTCDGRRWC